MNDAIVKKLGEIESVLARGVDKNLSLLAGKTGSAIFYAHLFELTGDQTMLEKCRSNVSSVMNSLPRVKIGHTFCNGFTGIAWGINYLIKRGYLDFGGHDIFDDLDDLIYQAARENLQRGYYDYLHGGIGAVVYAVERLPSPKAMAFLEDTVREIDRIKEHDEFGVKWRDPGFRKVTQLNMTRAYNLGMAHGILSIIQVLRMIYENDILKEQTSGLINLAISWLMKCKLNTPESLSFYPSTVFDKVEFNDGPSRLSWCYGDLTIALVLWKCGQTFNNAEWKQEALAIMRNSEPRTDLFKNKYLDACFCHGTAGVSHLFRRFYNETGIDEFRRRAEFWLEETLKQARHVTGLAGYRMHNQTEKNNIVYRRRVNRSGILEGVGGIGLVFISHLGNKPDWDRALLLS